MLRVTFIFALAVVVILVVLRLVSHHAMPAVGSRAPEFTLPSQEGQPVSLTQYRGQWIVLYFYPKDQTPGCTREAHNFSVDESKYAQRNTVVLGVSLDNVDSHKQFCTKEGLTFHLLADPEHKVVDAYGSLGHFGPMTIANRNTFLIDPTGKIAKVWTKVDPAVHSDQVLSAIGTMQQPVKPSATN